jgi:small redox-active disulfide protein 2
MKIKVLGPGCATCKELHENVLEAVGDSKEIEVEYITEMDALLKAGIMGAPALLIDDITISVGRVPSVDEIRDYIEARKNFKKSNTSQCGCGESCCS